MVGKGKIKKRLKQIQSLKNWQLFILLLLVIFVDLTALRLNNVGMVRRREAVESADKSGDVEATRKATVELANEPSRLRASLKVRTRMGIFLKRRKKLVVRDFMVDIRWHINNVFLMSRINTLQAIRARLRRNIQMFRNILIILLIHFGRQILQVGQL